ncbi:MAG: hypothetical protein J5555_02340 [Firmicutes bacterium]|nr:hypothetical protein [Bacillota bacterium]
MKPISLSILVVNCKDYKPFNNWYLCKSGRYLCGTAKSPDTIGYDEARLSEYEKSDDHVLMPECPGMTNEEAAVAVRYWCEKNDIPYIDDIDDIEAAHRWYYKYDDCDNSGQKSYIGYLCERG